MKSGCWPSFDPTGRFGETLPQLGLPFFLACVLLLFPTSAAFSTIAQAPECSDFDLRASTAAQSERGFTWVSGVEELGANLLAVLDRTERHVYVLSNDLRYRGTAGMHGEGPGEYLMPHSLSRLDGDSVALYDHFLGRLSVIGTDGAIRRSTIPRAVSGGPVRSVDGAAQGYRSVRAGASPQDGSVDQDHDRIQGWNREREAWETVATVPAGQLFEQDLPQLARERTAFRPVSTWTVSPDGVVAIVTAEPYRVRLFQPNGRALAGPELSYTRIPVTEEHRDRWRTERSSPSPVEVGRVGAPSGSSRIEVLSFPSYEPAEWAEHLPPFSEDAARFAPDGTLWVERTVDLRDEGMVDVFDRDADCIGRVRLPVGARLVGVGERGIYVVVKDEYDLEYLRLLAID